MAASKIDIGSPPGSAVVNPPSVPGTSSLRSRMLAKVPRIITSWWPRRAPYELKSRVFTPCAMSHLPAGLAAAMLPAGEMWSVVIESPNMPSTRAPVIGFTPGASIVIPSKYGGLAT